MTSERASAVRLSRTNCSFLAVMRKGKFRARTLLPIICLPRQRKRELYLQRPNSEPVHARAELQHCEPRREPSYLSAELFRSLLPKYGVDGDKFVDLGRAGDSERDRRSQSQSNQLASE